MESKEQDKKYQRLIALAILIPVILGISYGFFTSGIIGNPSNVGGIASEFEINLITANEGYINASDVMLIESNEVEEKSAKGYFQVVTGNNENYVEYSLSLTNLSISTNLQVNDFKWQLVCLNDSSKNTEGTFNGVSTNTMTLKSNILIGANKADEYELRIWLEETNEDQYNLIGGTFSGKVSLTATMIYRPLGEIMVDYDENMIPITHNGTVWVKADVNSNWYDYDNQQWANAVLVTDTNRETYKAATPGTLIPENDILAYYVYIPRYKYQLFNTNNQGVPVQEIKVEFQNKYDQKLSGTSNGQWLTHPAFTFGDSELNGIWVGKFTTSADPLGNCYLNIGVNVSTNDSYCNRSDITPRIKPNQDMWRYINVSNAFKVSQSFKINAIYGISTSSIDAHMMKNMEWGAVAYLTQSKYGKYGNDDYSGANKEVYINNYINPTSEHPYRTLTGCSAALPSSIRVTICANPYPASGTAPTNANTGASTTGNIYGIYDMSGGAWEYVMGNMVNAGGTFNISSSGFVSAPDSKYYDSYAYDGSANCSAGFPNEGCLSHGRGLLGDATRETLATFGISLSGGWYSDYIVFISYNMPWFLRGGDAVATGSGSTAGLFAFNRRSGENQWYYSFRSVLVNE